MTQMADMSQANGALPVQSLPVYRAGDLRVAAGANLGDSLADASELALGDVFVLCAGAERVRLGVQSGAESSDFTIVSGSDEGRAGGALHLDCVATFMTPDGSTVEGIILVETDGGMIETTYLLPLAPMGPKVEYALVKVSREDLRAKFGEVACVNFTRGTHITMASGAQVPIEDLKPGDRVLTRDNGVQAIRWIGQQTVRATGSFAPIVIRKGTLNNENDLILSPNHRLFIYQRIDALKAGRAEVLVKAKYLVNGESVVRSDGGFVDYFQLLFDGHEIIYAEGIAAESLYVDTRVKPVLPPEVQARLAEGMESSSQQAFEITEGALDAATAADLLRRVSAI